MSLDKKLIGGGPAPQCGIQGSTSTDSNKSLAGDNALEGLTAFSYNGSYWIAQTGGQSVYLYDGQGTLLNSANTSGINPYSIGFHNGRVYTYDTYQPTASGGWKSWNVTTSTWTEIDHNCNLPNVNGSTPYWHITDPLNPARMYYGNPFNSNVYIIYYADFPSTTVNGYVSGYTTPAGVSINEVTYDGNYFWLSEYGGSGGDFYQAYVGGSKGDPFELTGKTIPKVGGFDYYARMAYNGYDDRLWVKRASSSTILRQIPDYGNACPTPSYMDFLCVAGGGSGGRQNAGGGGAGGLRTSYGSATGGGNTISEGGLELIGGTYTITVGAGGSGPTSAGVGNNGTDSSITHPSLQTIDCLGGGAGYGVSAATTANSGGSGGGAGTTQSNTASSSGAGRTGQGRKGGDRYSSTNTYAGGGGGGANQEGAPSSAPEVGGNGGNGLTVSITGSSVTYAGGGGGGGGYNGGSAGTGGSGGGTNGGYQNGSTASCAANTGAGSGGARDNASTGSGGSGIVILRLPTASYSGVTTGSPTVTTSGSDTIIKFTGSGTYVHS